MVEFIGYTLNKSVSDSGDFVPQTPSEASPLDPNWGTAVL